MDYNNLSMSEHSKYLLADSQIPSVWVNVLPSLKEPLDPPLNLRHMQPTPVRARLPQLRRRVSRGA